MPEMAFFVRSWLTSANFTPGFAGSTSPRIMRPGVVSSDLDDFLAFLVSRSGSGP